MWTLSRVRSGRSSTCSVRIWIKCYHLCQSRDSPGTYVYTVHVIYKALDVVSGVFYTVKFPSAVYSCRTMVIHQYTCILCCTSIIGKLSWYFLSALIILVQGHATNSSPPSHRLDTQLRSYRESEWACMREEADELRRDMPQYNILELVTKLEDFVARIKSLAIEVGLSMSVHRLWSCDSVGVCGLWSYDSVCVSKVLFGLYIPYVL